MLRLLFCSVFFINSMAMTAAESFASDIFKTTAGDLKITFVGHGSLLFNFKNLNLYIDPFGQLADFSLMPKADLIVITHQHQDHFDSAAIEILRQKNTQILITAACQPAPMGSRVLKNFDHASEQGIDIDVVPAYNIVNQRSSGVPFHPRGEGNGYVFTFANLRVYVAGDTENIPEMSGLKNIDIAFLPMNLPYTMTPEMTAQAAKSFNPRILYPYHFGSSDTQRLAELLKDVPHITLRVRKMN